MNGVEKLSMGLNYNDKELVRRVKTDNCNESLQILINKHTPLFLQICQKFSTALQNKGFNIQDIYDDNYYVIYKAILSFNEAKKAKVSSWIGLFTKYHCLTLISQKNILCSAMEINDDKFYEQNTGETTDYIINILSQLKDDRILKIFKLRFFSPGHIPFEKISQELKISKQYTVILYRRGLKFLNDKFKSKENCDFV